MVRAHIKAEDYQAADSLLSNFQLTCNEEDWMEIYLFNARDLLLQNQKVMGNKCLDKIIYAISKSPMLEEYDYQRLLSESYFLKEDYQKAQAVLERLLQKSPDLIPQTALLAMCYQKTGRPKHATELLDRLDQLRGAYQYGSVDYAIAQYYSFLGDDNNVIKYLMKAVAAGRWYDPVSFQNDLFFKDYASTQSFDQIMNFWH